MLLSPSMLNVQAYTDSAAWITHSIKPINGHALAVTCRLSNLHPVLIHVFLLCVQCDHPLSFIYTQCCVNVLRRKQFIIKLKTIYYKAVLYERV